MRALGPNPLHHCSASVADFFLPNSIKNALCVSHISVCVCVCVCERACLFYIAFVL